MGRTDEQLQNVSTGDNNQGTDRSILSKEAEETKPSAFSVNEEAIHNAFNELNLNHSFSAEQKLFFDRIEQFATKNNVTENIIDRAFSERPVYRRTYGNRDKLSQNLFNHSLKVLESELERVIRKNLAESNEKSVVSVEQESSETTNVHSEKTEGQEMANIFDASKDIVAVNDDVSEEIIISSEDEIFEHNAAVLNDTQVDDIELGDIFSYKGREYTVVSMQGIYPDDVGISYNETMSNGTVYAVTENVDRHKLAREGIYLGKSDKLTQESTAIEYSEVTRSMYQTDNPDVLIIEGKGSLAKIDITPTEELRNRLAEKGIVRTNESVDRIIFNTDNLNWNKLVIPDKWGNMTNNIDIDKVFTENEVRIAQSVADDVITPTLEGSQLSMFDEHITDDIILPTEEAPEEVLQVNEFENKQSEIIQDNTTKTDFTITDDKLGEGGAKTKFRANVEAIKTLKTIEAEERTATPEEQEILSKYVGWGGLKNAFEDFHDDWKKEFSELKELLTPEEYKLAKASVLNAHYTSPLVIEKMYEALRNNGFTGGKILEPAMGIGNYFGKMPEDIRSSSNLYGVELDDISGRIAKQLYQNANIRITGFEKTLFKDNSFDLAIGNVPFGAYSLNEPKYNKYHFQIHDHFFAKSLDKVKPGGIVAFITSKGTLDKKNPDVRKYLAERAELVGAIRLPNNAFKNNAGTEVTSDIIFLQKREIPIELTPFSTPDWVHLGKTDNGLTVNQYFIDNPQMVLGNIVAGNKLYGHGNDDTMCEAIEGADLSEQLSEAIKHINFEVLENREEMAVEDTIAEIPSGIKNFSYAVINDKIYYRNNDEMELFNGKKSDIPRIKAMIDIRDTLRELIACQLDNGSDEQLHELQTKLNAVYDSFVAKYGRLNDKINVKAIKEDSSAPLLSSLEIYKGEEFSEKAAIFEKRTILAKNDVTSADTSSEALTLSLAKKACVDMAYMQELTGFSEEKILSELKGVVFENPIKMDENGKPRLEASDEYLSGNIRTKLEYMKTFHAGDSRYAHNIAALEAAMPTRIEAADIDVKLGSPCVKPEIIQQFMYDTFKTPQYKQDFGLGYKDSVTVQYAEINSTWFIPNKSSEKNNTAANSKFGTQRCSAYELLEDCLNLKNTVVKDAIERDVKKAYVLNQKETEFAQEKQRQLQETFKNWIFADPVRREEVVETYNRMFNSIRPREYDGSVLEFPGMNNEIQLRKHQRDAVAHALYGGNTLFTHEVGAGKTFEMIAAAMEGKRLGLHHKAMICVPNHLTEQIGADFIKLYPNANVLVATSKDFTKNNRRKLFGKIATGDYDGIIIGHSQLVNLPISKERQQNLLEREIDEIVAAIAALKAQNGQSYQVKQLERTKKSLEIKLRKLIEAPRRDDVVDFEELGIDKLILDEAHEFKNLFIATKMGNISGIATNDDVQKTFDLYLKCQYLDEITNNKGLIFATGTPVSNSISEIYNMQKYLQSDLLRETGLNHFDMWAANFAETVTESQLSPEGNKYQMKTRFAKFNNLPELMALFKECADIKTADMLGLKTPECTMHSVVAQPSGIQKSMIENLAERAKRIRLREVDRKDDNMPMITNDGRKIGLDQRLMNPDLPDDKNSKLNTCINNVYDIWDKTADKRLTQVIFCDLGVPQSSNDKKKKGERFSVYDDIKNKLIAKGVPADEIAFIHDAATEEAKDKLFAKVRKGDVRVLIGSTKKMGTGTNIQTKLVALHDLDAPWRPADMDQRRGRMVRQGNENEHVDHFRYVTEGTFDAYLYQMLENKQKFISQIMTSKSPVRSCQDMDEVTLSYAEVKALSAGNPLIKEKMDLDIEVGKLKMLKSAHENNLYKLQNEVTTHLPMKIQYLKNEINGITADIEKAKKSPITYDSDGKAVFPSIEINGKVFTDKEEAGKALIAAFQAAVEKDYSKNHEIGNYRGFKLLVAYNPLEKSYSGMLQGEAKHITTLGGSETGNFTRLDNLISTMDRRLIDAHRKLDGLVVELEEAKTQLDVPFPREEELKEKTKRLDELTKMLEEVADESIEKTPDINTIAEPYYIGECTPEAISLLEKNGIYFETNTIDDKTYVKINEKDKDAAHNLLSKKPKLTL
ncbi:MAG: helicase [Ruminococcus sp.]|nr:helicase [Ruminococcus sp.]